MCTRSIHFQAGFPSSQKLDRGLQSLSIQDRHGSVYYQEPTMLNCQPTKKPSMRKNQYLKSSLKRTIQSTVQERQFESNVFEKSNDSAVRTPCKRCKRNRPSSTLASFGANKKVTFSPETKIHDGLSESSLLLDELVYVRANNPQMIASPKGIVQFVNAKTGRLRSHQLTTLTQKLCKLLERMNENRGEPIRLLTHGGGRNQMIMCSPINIRCVRQLERLCQETHSRLVCLYRLRFGSVPTATNLNQSSIASPVQTAIVTA